MDNVVNVRRTQDTQQITCFDRSDKIVVILCSLDAINIHSASFRKLRSYVDFTEVLVSHAM